MYVCIYIMYLYILTHLVKICCFYVKCVLDCILVGGALEIYALTSIISASKYSHATKTSENMYWVIS